jgi:hypothetical protein
MLSVRAVSSSVRLVGSTTSTFGPALTTSERQALRIHWARAGAVSSGDG